METLAAILRVADALDRSHQSLVKAVTCEVSASSIKIQCASRGAIDAEIEAVHRKGDLLRRLLSRDIVVRCYSL